MFKVAAAAVIRMPDFNTNIFKIWELNDSSEFPFFIIADKWVRRNHDEKLLPGLGKYSQRQMFWISAANVWCAKYRDKALKLRVLTGVHSPDMFRDGRRLVTDAGNKSNHSLQAKYLFA